MLQFPEDYFKKEIRDGFPVGEIMKRVWAASLEVLQRVIDICERHQITYFVFWGSMLGAVRHEGFIPWDDDLDIAMTGEDYVRFLSVAVRELPEEYCVLNVYTENEFSNYFTRITNGRTIDVGENRMKEYHGCPFSVGIDVFPLYYIPRDEQCREELKNLLRVIGQLSRLIDYRKKIEADGANAATLQKYSEGIAQGLVDLQNVTGFQFGGSKTLRTQLTMLYDQLCRMYTEEESDFVTAFPHYLESNYYIPKELVQETIMMPFENLTVRVPQGYDEALTRNFGNYMQPVRGGGHDYIYFKAQIKDLLKRLGIGRVQVASSQKWGSLEEASPKLMVGKKIVLFYTGWEGIFCNSGFAIDKLKYVLDTFRKNPEILLWWYDEPLAEKTKELIGQMMPDLVTEYWEIVQEYKAEGWGIYDDSGNAYTAIGICDAYYGDWGELLQHCKAAGKLIMIQDYEII